MTLISSHVYVNMFEDELDGVEYLKHWKSPTQELYGESTKRIAYNLLLVLEALPSVLLDETVILHNGIVDPAALIKT